MKSPSIARNSAATWKSLYMQDCVVADAVQVEPVSTLKFPANREINREFRQIPARGATLIADT
jgi:hypothetical protein